MLMTEDVITIDTNQKNVENDIVGFRYTENLTPEQPKRKRQKGDYRVKGKLLSVEAAAERLNIDVETLRLATEWNNGTMPVAEAAALLGIKDDALYAAANPESKYPKFPDAIPQKESRDEYLKRLPATGRAQERKRVRRLVNILHPQFVAWATNENGNGYKPQQNRNKEKNLVPCAVNEVAGYTDADGEYHYIDHCPNLVEEGKSRFCSTEHYWLYRRAKGEYSQMGRKGHEGKGHARAGKDRSAAATRRRSQAAVKGLRGRGRVNNSPFKRTRVKSSSNSLGLAAAG